MGEDGGVAAVGAVAGARVGADLGAALGAATGGETVGEALGACASEVAASERSTRTMNGEQAIADKIKQRCRERER